MKFAELLIPKIEPGVEVPTPTRPAFVTVKCEMVDEPMAKDGVPSVVVLIIETSIANLPHGVEVPKPTLPEKTLVPQTVSAGVLDAAVEVALCPTVKSVRTARPSAVVYPASETERYG